MHGLVYRMALVNEARNERLLNQTLSGEISSEIIYCVVFGEYENTDY